MSICYNFTQPEMLGCIEPSVVACTTKEPNALGTGMVSRAAPVPERLGHLAQRMRRWHVLQTAAPADKRLAIMLHNSPCKSVEGTVAEAAGLDAAESTVRLLRRLRNEGWRVDDIPADGAALLTMILERKALQEFRWTNVEEIVAKGGVLARIDQASYEADFERLLPATREEVNEAWGPFPGEAMVHDADGGNPVLLITGLRFGNVTVMVEPKRGCYGPRCDGEVCRILHEPDIAPSHHWLATYWWVQREADAVVQMGAESPLEFLPGKRAGLSDRCYPEISLGTLPSIYPYIMNSTAEGLLAKRRGRAVIVDHLSPPVRRGQELSEQWAGIEELHRQFMAAREAGEAGRLAAITRELRPAMETMNLLPPNAGDEQFRRRLDELPRRLEKLRGRLVETGSHVLGRMPSPEDRDCYMAEADGNGRHGIDVQELSAALERTTDEMDRVVAALNGRFVPAGPSGHLSRGKVDALPTGRNIYGIDVNTIPTAAACDVGAQMGRLVLQKHLREEGRLPESIGVTVWSSDAFLRDGELTGQVLWLLGCRPVWGRGGRVSGIEVLPLDELTMLDSAGQRIQRPRVDVVVQMSAVTRDTLPNLYGLLDDAVTQVAALDESPERNLVRKHVAERLDALREKMQDTDEAILRRLATFRVFSAKPGSYGEGVGLAVDASAWETDKDLAETFVNWCGYAYGRDTSGEGTAAGDAEVTMREFAHLMGGIDVAYQKAVGPEYDALSISCYAGFQGGMAATKRAVGGTSAKLYWGDSVTSDTLDVRDLAEEIDLSMLGKLLNPDWIERQKEEGYRGASAVAGMVNTAFAWSATSHVVSKEQFDAMCRTFIEDEENRRWLGTANVYALEEISRRLLEAAARKLWDADEQSMQALQSAVLEIEGDIEERMGPVQGEFQGGSVDIFTKDSVDKWKPEFTVP
jgi:cobaltochelatase CobN